MDQEDPAVVHRVSHPLSEQHTGPEDLRGLGDQGLQMSAARGLVLGVKGSVVVDTRVGGHPGVTSSSVPLVSGVVRTSWMASVECPAHTSNWFMISSGGDLNRPKISRGPRDLKRGPRPR